MCDVCLMSNLSVATYWSGHFSFCSVIIINITLGISEYVISQEVDNSVRLKIASLLGLLSKTPGFSSDCIVDDVISTLNHDSKSFQRFFLVLLPNSCVCQAPPDDTKEIIYSIRNLET